MSLPEHFIRRPIATVLLTLGVALAGIGAYFLLPVSPLPQVDFPTISVQAVLPGASPETMATSVAGPLERRLGIISDVSQMTSSSRVGQTNITLQFGLDRDIDGAARDVQAAINASRVDLPATLRTNPTYRKQNPADAPILILALTSRTRTPGQIYDVANTVIQQQILQVKGVGDVTLGGASLPAVRVELNPLALARYGISLEDVRAALASANANRPKGVVQNGVQSFQIYTNDTGLSAAWYAPLLVAYRNGQAVRLSDVAQVVDGVEDVHNLGLVNGKPAVVVVVRRAPGANIIGTVDRVKALIPTLREVLPADINMQVALDRTVTIRASLADVERTVIVSTLLVIAVTAFFLRNGRAILVPSVAVAVSLLGALGVMFLLGFSLDNLSLMALTVSTGFVVDDAIVVLENITRHVEQGMGRLEAALLGAREVAFTVFSITVSLIAVFLPILLMGGIVGRLFREFAMTLSAAVLVSLAVSLATTPMMAAYLVDPPKPAARQRWFARLSDSVFSRMQRLYERGLNFSLDAGPLMLFVLLATIGLSVWLWAAVPKGFFPQQDTGVMIGGLQTDQSSSFKISGQHIRQFVDIIRRDPSVATVVAFAGRNAAGGFLITSLKPRSQRKGGAMAVIARLRPKLARVSGANLFLAPAQDLQVGGRQANAAYQFTLKADNLADLRLWAGRLAEAMKSEPALEDVNTDQEDHGLESFVSIDRDKAARLGLTDTQIDNTLYDAFGQRQVSTIYKETNQYHVVMEADPKFTQDPTALRWIYVSSGEAAATGTGGSSLPAAAKSASSAVVASAAPTAPVQLLTGQPGAQPHVAQALAVGANAVAGPTAPPARGASQGVAVSAVAEKMVPLSAFASWADNATPTAVNHQDGQPATTISFNLAQGASLSQATSAISDAEARVGLPANIHGGFQGTALAFQQSLVAEPMLVLAALVAVYLVLGILYESYVQPLTVLSTLPAAGLGAVVALILFHIEFSIIALIGVILLIGIVKKNAILMIDFALDAERELGLTPREAIRRAALIRFRPIMMTTFAAMLGALPLAIGGGEGSELRRPLGVAIIGGLLVSQLITLLTTPVVYLYFDRLRTRTRRQSRTPAGALEPAR
ncbi:MAG TPA: efflux RND transporter permease subunit [Caulobacteraceae bacterium]|nr:efflux RND transporter permease subunit [Caulobacteraceae bacterium]